MSDPADTARLLASVAGDKYSYREMDNFTDVIERQLKLIPLVSKVERVGVLDERVYLTYSQNRLAAYGLSPVAFLQALRQRNVTAATKTIRCLLPLRPTPNSNRSRRSCKN